MTPELAYLLEQPNRNLSLLTSMSAFVLRRDRERDRVGGEKENFLPFWAVLRSPALTGLLFIALMATEMGRERLQLGLKSHVVFNVAAVGKVVFEFAKRENVI